MANIWSDLKKNSPRSLNASEKKKRSDIVTEIYDKIQKLKLY